MNDKEIGKISQRVRCQMTEGVVGQETGRECGTHVGKINRARKRRQKGGVGSSVLVLVKLVSCVSKSRAEGGTRPRWCNVVTERGGKEHQSGFRCQTG
jgi:hypothetical protein